MRFAAETIESNDPVALHKTWKYLSAEYTVRQFRKPFLLIRASLGNARDANRESCARTNETRQIRYTASVFWESFDVMFSTADVLKAGAPSCQGGCPGVLTASSHGASYF